MSEWEVWRRGTMRMILIAGGALCTGRGCLEGALPDSDEFYAILLVLVGLLGILHGLRPKGGG